MKTELWNGHQIRFIELSGEWFAIAKDVTDALEYLNGPKAIKDHVDSEDKNTVTIRYGIKGNPNRVVISEFGIYDLIFNSNMKQAKQFKRWVFNVIKTLRTQSGLEGFEIFRTLDKEHQRKMMNQLSQSLSHPVRLNFMKANTVANKAVSNKFGFKKMIKKGEMTPQMLAEREHILEDIVNLMALQDKYGLNISISQTIYKSANDKQLQPV
ncbi:Bro-N domain-containing protein [Liquorilactobacillus satsumensis]|uniref:BRO-N domain-containing protein n=1 Tax=Liquorilactobacillus TaxID=2767888 RepID=UPI0021C2803E|nr:BRO family protein [Liquorilactobacillus satsumensis]MCP9313846.1 phage repressor protein [Liquorilactobacillus satsumensis]MCP9360987.1 phage repressor protein [Liquorilactobacillus satsumensis]